MKIPDWSEWLPMYLGKNLRLSSQNKISIDINIYMSIWDVIMFLDYSTQYVLTGEYYYLFGYESCSVMISAHFWTVHRCFPVLHWFTVAFTSMFLGRAFLPCVWGLWWVWVHSASYKILYFLYVRCMFDFSTLLVMCNTWINSCGRRKLLGWVILQMCLCGSAIYYRCGQLSWTVRSFGVCLGVPSWLASYLLL